MAKRPPQAKTRTAPAARELLEQGKIRGLDTGRMDRRCRQSKVLEGTVAALENDPRGALKALLRGALATGALLQNELLTEAQRDEFVGEDGRLTEALRDDLLRVQRNLVSIASLLGQLEGAFPQRKNLVPGGKKPKPDVTVASLILADNADTDEEGGREDCR